MPPFAAALLAGGQSRRMGRDKAWLDWKGEPLWQVQCRKLAVLNPSLLLISCREEQGICRPGATLVYDPPEATGPLTALLRCLEVAGLPLLVLAVDMPAMTSAFLKRLAEQGTLSPGSGVICRGTHGTEPLCAFYPLEVVSLLKVAVAKGNLRLQSFAESALADGLMREMPVAPSELSYFANVNRPEDLDTE